MLNMKALTINLPKELELEEFEIKMILAGHLYKKEKATLGQAAEIVGISKLAFTEIMGRFGFSIFGDSVEDLKTDILNA